MHNAECTISVKDLKGLIGALIGRGADGRVGGQGMRAICWDAPGRFIDVEGADEHRSSLVPLASLSGMTMTNHGPVTLVPGERATCSLVVFRRTHWE